MDSDEMRDARRQNWYAHTDWGIAVLSYEDNRLLMKDQRLSQGSTRWPAHHGVTSGEYHDWWGNTLLVLEGADHHRVRRVVNPAFSQRRILPLHPRFRALAEELLEEWVDRGETEFARSFAAPYSTQVLCMILGIDEADWKRIYDLSSTLGLGISVAIAENIDAINTAVSELTRYTECLVASRREAPQDDILTDLVQATDQGDSKLDDAELINLVILLVFAGIDTTRNQLTLALESFSRQPDQWEKLAADPDRYAATAVEETLRTNPIARWVTREANQTFQHKNYTIKEGTTVHMFTLSSGTDPAEYDNPDLIDLDQQRSPHFAFGGGIHHCLGHFLARADLTVALSVLATRLTDIKVGADADWLPDSGNTGAKTLPITFSKR
ncbi:cytochrome P450 [Janibacter melonis]|uniref:cytochrome P450 n=1 Tax=Janibacter melonis TaxID=262209 RepID=UPI002042CFE9|nr:cytochrome P450 [Janibacter melonis]MCM3556831.1 cytochrome P450 [Janibacter melonis]